jgi:hypothetical protein
VNESDNEEVLRRGQRTKAASSRVKTATRLERDAAWTGDLAMCGAPLRRPLRSPLGLEIVAAPWSVACGRHRHVIVAAAACEVFDVHARHGGRGLVGPHRQASSSHSSSSVSMALSARVAAFAALATSSTTITTAAWPGLSAPPAPHTQSLSAAKGGPHSSSPSTQ